MALNPRLVHQNPLKVEIVHTRRTDGNFNIRIYIDGVLTNEIVNSKSRVELSEYEDGGPLLTGDGSGPKRYLPQPSRVFKRYLTTVPRKPKA